MGRRGRKAIASIGILVFVIVYAFVAAAIGRSLPDIWWLKLAFYAAAGIGWGVPIIPLIRWANRSNNGV